MGNPRDRIGASKWGLDTPCLVIDQDLLEKNIRTMQDYLHSPGKNSALTPKPINARPSLRSRWRRGRRNLRGQSLRG